MSTGSRQMSTGLLEISPALQERNVSTEVTAGVAPVLVMPDGVVLRSVPIWYVVGQICYYAICS